MNASKPKITLSDSIVLRWIEMKLSLIFDDTDKVETCNSRFTEMKNARKYVTYNLYTYNYFHRETIDQS